MADLLLLTGQQAAAASPAHWVGTWASAQILADGADVLPPSAPKDGTLRELVRVSLGGTNIRVRISNRFGTTPLVLSDAAVAPAISPASPRIDPARKHDLTFSGDRSVIVPAGAEYVSDPVSMKVPPLSTLAVSIHYLGLPKGVTAHPGSRATSYVAPGDQIASAELAGGSALEHWYFLAGVDVEAANSCSAIVALGDSITDGHGVPTNSNGRWTDVLAERLDASHPRLCRSVLNTGIGGNRVVDDGIGPNAAARFGRDVLGRSGVRYAIVFEGVNDLGVLTRDKPAAPGQHRMMVERILAVYRQMIARAHEHGMRAIGATITPYGGSGYYHPDAADEADRRRVNAWIRSPGHFDALIDFDRLLRDPARPDRLRKDYDSGDGLHPSQAGYRAMGEAVPLSLFGGGGS